MFVDLPVNGFAPAEAAAEKVLLWRRLERDPASAHVVGEWVDDLNQHLRRAGLRRVICEPGPMDFDVLKGWVAALSAIPMEISLALVAELVGDLPAIPDLNPGGPSIRMVHWRLRGGAMKPIGLILHAFSRAGIWNHIAASKGAAKAWTADFHRFGQENPNLVHSFEKSADVTGEAAAYSRVAPLPGRPFWRSVADWRSLFLAVDLEGVPAVMRRRILGDGSIHTVGGDLSFRYQNPEELPAGYLDEICRMVASGGSVATEYVRHNLERAFLIGYATELGVIVGNSSLKHPRSDYLEGLSRKAGLDLSAYLERGYTSVRPEYRGLGIDTRLLEGLTARVGNHKLFSLIAEDNLATQKIARRNRTRKVATFFSDKAGKPMGVWIPEWMIDR